MKAMDTAITHDLDEVNARVKADAAAFVAEEEAAYAAQIEAAAQAIVKTTRGCQPVMLCGPSSVGKTTTARRLCEAIEKRGVAAFVVSLDDFYRGAGLAPVLPNGEYDYESPEALDLERLYRCMKELMTTGETWLPRYDFTAGRPAAEETLLHTVGDTVVIFEGINAFSEEVNVGFAGTGVTPVRVFLNTRSRFVRGGEVQLSRRDIRLSRRLLRDIRTRGSSFANTMSMWEQVKAGEEKYILPFSHTADITLDTTMGYEPCLLAPLLLEHLGELVGTPYAELAARGIAVYQTMTPLPLSLLDKESVLCEFVGCPQNACTNSENGV